MYINAHVCTAHSFAGLGIEAKLYDCTCAVINSIDACMHVCSKNA